MFTEANWNAWASNARFGGNWFYFLFQRNYIIKCNVYTSSVGFNANQTLENPFEDFCCRGHLLENLELAIERENGSGTKIFPKIVSIYHRLRPIYIYAIEFRISTISISFAFTLHTFFVPCHSSFAFESFVENCEYNSITVVGIKNNDFIAVISPILNFQSIDCTDFTRAPAQSNENSFIFVIDTIFFHFISFPRYTLSNFHSFSSVAR